MNNLIFERLEGRGFEEVFDGLAALRIAVFRDFPYLYEGSADYEKQYLQTYANSARSFLFTVSDNGKMVGATTCIPLEDETEEVQKPFLQAGFDTSKVFYFGESLLLPAYRGLGLGHRYFEEREAHARKFGVFKWTSFCAVVRPDDHPLKPGQYRPHDEFWMKRGYRKAPELTSYFDWPDIGEPASTPKEMVYWLKSLENI